MADDRDLQAQIDSLKARVAALEAERGILAPQGSPEQWNSATVARDARPVATGLGLKIVNRVGAITLAVGIIFFFKYAAENEWIGPAMRVFSGIGLAALLVAVSEWFARRGQGVFSQGLAGTGLATLYISLYAAFGFYRLIGAGVAFGCLTIVSAGVIALAVWRRSAAVAALGILGALLTPQLVELARPATWVTVQSGYLLLLQITALVAAVRLQSSVLPPIAAGMVTITALHRVRPYASGTFGLLMLALAIVHFGVWAYRNVAFQSANRTVVLSCAHCFLALAGLQAVTSWTGQRAVRSASGSIFLATYGVALLARGLAADAGPDRNLGLSFLGLVVLKLYLIDIWALAFGARITAFVALGVLLLLASFLYSRARTKA
jgi:uncharacterized membrane protein